MFLIYISGTPPNKRYVLTRLKLVKSSPYLLSLYQRRNEMNGVFLDSAIKSLARYLVKLEDLVTTKYNGNVDVKGEIESLNQQYGFVSSDQVAAFTNDIYRMYQFERNRELQSIDGKAYAKFKWDQATGANDLQRLKNDLHNELTGLTRTQVNQ